MPGGTVLHDRDLETLRLVDEEKLIRVSQAHMTSASGRSITLSTGEKVETDAVIFCTGWEMALPHLFPTPLAQELGLPVDPKLVPQEEREYWTALDIPAENRILKTYPVLQNPPSNIHIRKSTLTPFRHFRAMVPPKLAVRGDNSLVFLGNYATGKIQATAEMYSLWAVAYLEGLLTDDAKAMLSNKEAMDEDIAHNEAYRKKRYLNGLPYRVTLIESTEFEALVLKDLDVRSDRKAMKIPSGWRGWFGLKGWFAEWFECYYASDFEGIIDEFLEALEKRGGGSKFVSERTPLMNGIKE
jgi:dimethylaniline monooxygenase (N-oxide forming)